MKRLLSAYRRACFKAKNADQSDWPWISQGLLRLVDEETLDLLRVNSANRRKFAKANPVTKVRILGPYLQTAAKAEEKAKQKNELGRLGEAIAAFKKSAKTWTQGIRFSPEKLYSLVRASSAKSLAFQLGGKTQLYFPLPLIRRTLKDLRGLTEVTVDLRRKDNRLCLSYLNEDGRRGNMRFVAHSTAEDQQKVLSLDLRPWVRPARVVPSRSVLKPVAVSIPRKGGLMDWLAEWFEDFVEGLG